MTSDNQSCSVACSNRQPVFRLNYLHVRKLGKLLDELVFLVAQGAWILSQFFHGAHLGIDLRNLLGQAVDLADRLCNRLVEARLDGVQIVFGLLKVASEILSGRQHCLALGNTRWICG